MSNKKTAPPPRPPAPRMGGGAGGISLSFKALEEEDDEELTVVTGMFDKQVHDVKEKHEREKSLSRSPDITTTGMFDRHVREARDRQTLQHDRERSPSKSPDITNSAAERHSIKSQNSLEKLIDIKGKIQDTISKKIEEFSSESPAKPGKEKTPLEHRNSDELEDSVPYNHHENGEENDRGSEKDLDIDNDYFVDPDEEFVGGTNGVEEVGEDSLELDEEYYNPDAEDFSELPGVVSSVRQRKKFQKFRKIKPIKPPSPVTMSKLTHHIPVNTSEVNNSAAEPKVQKQESVEHATKPREAVVEIHGVGIPVKTLAVSAIVLCLYLILPMPSYLRGMILGIVLSSSGWMLYLWVTKPPKPREPIPEDLPLDKLPPLPVPELKEPKGEDCSYKGWMNEVTEYCPDSYSINQTHSVYVHLDGTSLRLRRPKVGVPKRATWDELTPTPQFIHQRHFELEDSRVLLIPPGLVKKRLWSKKYPICIALAKDGKKHSVKHDGPASAGGSRAGNQSPGRMSTSSSVDSVQGFELVNEQKCDTAILYLFARTCHEKEQWFKRLECAAKGIPLRNHILEIQRILSTSSRHRRSSSSDSLKQKRQESSDSLSSLGNNSPTVEEAPSPENDLREFVMYMSRLVPRDKGSLPSSPAHTAKVDGKTGDSKVSFSGVPRGILCDPVLLPLNALLGRCFFDFLKDQYWQEKVKDKLQKKLSKIHIPYFIEELQISDIDLGTEVPVIRRANRPYLDENGFWVDLDLNYSGKFKMTIETKVNLLRLKQAPQGAETPTEKHDTKRSAVTDSDEEDSAESSTDEEEEASTVSEEGIQQQGGTGKKLMKVMNKITASRYFQKATENRYIRRAMTEVSNTRLILTVEVQKLQGTLAINIPAPPTDRLWYGFRGNPQLWLVAKPKVGEREVTMSHITEWIEKKLASEFQLLLVMPNMDDLVIPILLPGETVAATVPADNPSGSEV